MKKLLTLLSIFMVNQAIDAQVDLAYQMPDEAILEWANAPMTPGIRVNSAGDYMMLLERDKYKSIVDLSDEEMRLGGLRINPQTNISSRVTYYKGMSIQKVGDKDRLFIKDMPANARLTNFSWSPDEKYMAFTNTTENGVELWIVEVKKGKVKKLTTDNFECQHG